MQLLTPPTATPEWYSSALNTLRAIEESIEDYAEEDFLVPDREVFDAVRLFFEDLCTSSPGLKLGQPDISPSPNGHLELTYRGDATALVVDFKPQLQFYAKSRDGEQIGYTASDAFEFIRKHFRL